MVPNYNGQYLFIIRVCYGKAQKEISKTIK